ncbi:septum site-determining protein MinD [Desulforhabdus amnigena]|jgi:septum site-determining protein MinD|uniref:Septum site-determining protein MinD n=1 Tax=Desulforhabdus amnigena TaxID=40218 RepID=A0A9W6FSV2_9BACT|nr:septum site-determining protein MinD [Desulforhabdus amnigena]NLJ26956.1 septum site-determining protein MinD [Deltaproteobacteria bacterium]GLI34474.1 site-determining protein [Desulforhabdus amnigena]
MAGKVIVVTSGKGGVGKTTTVANIGTTLAKKKHSVVLIDGDIGLRNLDVVMGVENRIVYNLVDIIEGRCRKEQAMIRDRKLNNLYIIPSAQTRDKDAVEPEQMKKLCTELAEEFDFVFIDCPAGIEQGFRNAIAGAQAALVVTTPEVSAIRDADRVIGLLEASLLKDIHLIVNRLNQRMVKKGDMMSTEDIVSLLAVPLLGIVPESEEVVISTNRGVPLVHERGSKAGLAFQKIAARLQGDNVPLEEGNNGTFLGRMKRFIWS